MKKHPDVIALEIWLESNEGQKCLVGQATGIYLKNRLTRAFLAGRESNEKPKTL